jgi:hypothetical protein
VEAERCAGGNPRIGEMARSYKADVFRGGRSMLDGAVEAVDAAF